MSEVVSETLKEDTFIRVFACRRYIWLWLLSATQEKCNFCILIKGPITRYKNKPLVERWDIPLLRRLHLGPEILHFTNTVWPFNAQVSTLLPEFLDFCWARTPIGDIKAKSKGGSNGEVPWIEQKTEPGPEWEWGLEKAEGKQSCLGAAQRTLQQLLLGAETYLWSDVTERLRSVKETHTLGLNLDL